MVINILELNKDNFNEFTGSGLKMVYLGASWCGPCKVLGPIIDQMAIEYASENTTVKIGKLNVDDNRDVAVSLGVTSIPTILVYKDGVLVDRNIGMTQKTQLKTLMEKYIS